MSDLETSVVISAQTDELQSGMEAAANSVQVATDAMRAQFAGLGAAAQQAQMQISSASAQVGSSIGALQARASGIAGSVDGMMANTVGNGRAERQLAMQEERDQINRLSADQRISDEKFARYKAEIQDEAAFGKLSATEAIRQEQDLLDLKWSYDQAYYEKKLAAADNDGRMQEKILEQQGLAYEKYVTNVQALDAKMAEANIKELGTIWSPRSSARSTGRSPASSSARRPCKKALANLAQSIIAEFVNSAVKGAFDQIGNLLAGGWLRGGNQDFSGGLTGASEEVAGSGLAEGLGLTSLFGSGGLLGGLFKGIGSLFAFEGGGIVPSAQGGWAVPSLGPGGVLAQLHSNEMVLPANISQGLQSMLAAPADAGGAGGTASSPVIVNVSAIDSQDVKRFFQSNGSLLVAALNKAMRNGSALRTA